MIRKLIIYCIFISYTIVLSHSIVPHHDHDLLLNTNNPEIHSAEDHSHHEGFNLISVFNSYEHAGNKQLYIQDHSYQLNSKVKKKFYQERYIDRILTKNNSPPSYIIHYENSSFYFKNTLFNPCGLRAPPIS